MSVAPNRYPVRVERVEAEEHGVGLRIQWSDNENTVLSSKTLREQCPCATCREKRGDTSHQRPLAAGRSRLQVVDASAETETGLRQLWAVGNYALGMRFADGHDSGIFSFELLNTLAQDYGETQS